MNRNWNQTGSEATHTRLQANLEEWAQYHTLYQEARKDWAEFSQALSTLLETDVEVTA